MAVGNVCFHLTTRSTLLQVIYMPEPAPEPPQHTGEPEKKPVFYDTCDAGVLIGKFPCLESTLAQSVADTPGGRRGRPSVTYHMNCSFVSCGGKQRGANSVPHRVCGSPAGVTVTQTRVQTRYGQQHTAAAPLPPPPAENSTACRPPLGSQLNNTGD